MPSRWWLAMLIGGAATVAAAASASQDPGRGSTGDGGPPRLPLPRADPAAGRPAYLAGFEDRRSVVLDARGRVVHVLPRSIASDAQACPGSSRRIASAREWSGDLQVHTLGGKRKWRGRIPVAGVDALSCLDARGTRVAVATLSESQPDLIVRIVSRRGSRVVLRTRGQIPLLTRELAYETDSSGVHLRSLADGSTVRDIATPPAPHLVLPSPDGRRLALTHIDDSNKDRSFLVDVTTGEVRRIAIPRLTLLGWVANDRLAVRSDKHLRELDTSLTERRAVPGFAPLSALITPGGDVVASDGTALIRVRRGANRVERIGTVPEGVYPREAIGG